MGMASQAEKQDYLRGRFGSTAPSTKPATWYLGLSTTQPETDETGVITNITEFVAGGYARIALANNNTVWGISDTEATLLTPVSWTATANATEDSPAYWVIYPSNTSTVASYAGDLSGAINWVAGATVTIAALTVSLPDV